MSVFYDLYEDPELTQNGEEETLHARVVLKGSYNTEEFMNQVVMCQHVAHAQLVGILDAVTSELKDLLLKGFSVELGELGYVTLSLKVNKKVSDPKDIRSPSVSLKNVNLRINRQFKKDIANRIELERFHSPLRVKDPMSEERCLQQLIKFFEKQPCINRRDYAMLVGKTKKQALQDINAFIERGILKKYGTGRSVVYMKVQ